MGLDNLQKGRMEKVSAVIQSIPDRWEAKLSNGCSFYEDGSKSWLKLKEFVELNGLSIESLRYVQNSGLKPRSIELPQVCEYYFFSKKHISYFGVYDFDATGIGYGHNGFCHIFWFINDGRCWIEENRPIEKCGNFLIKNKNSNTNNSQ